VSRRGRALGFVLAALLAATAAAAIADGYGDSVARGYGELRPVVVAGEVLTAGEPIDPARAVAALEVRRVPRRFVPAGTLRAPAEAVGLAPTGVVPVGAYLVAAQLRPPRAEGTTPGAGRGRHPVEVAVSGADALLVGGSPEGGFVDVVVTTEPTAAGAGRTYVGASGVRLLALRPGEAGAEGAARATLALTRQQALRLIAAESFARRLTLLQRG
jgi:hypothetical protein